ncbi:MAG TPA: peptidyl-prolyl cis-trans isomerase [Bryobacteraceae bacterium]|nr:peptidyl-prolyl cis-trans isomerase [Bryobacteraceae bacterium]
MKLWRFCALPLVCAFAFAAEVGVVEEIIAKVNGDIITRSEIERSRKALEMELRQRGAADTDLAKALEEGEKDLLRSRIDQMLLVQKGKELSLSVDPEVRKYLAELQVSRKIADPDKFQEYVRQQTGQPFEDFKNEMRNNFLTQRVIRQEVGGRINIPRSEIEKYYNEHKDEFVRKETIFLREITISTEGKDAAGIAAAEKKAKDVAARAKKGERFPELVKQFSESKTKEDGGLLPPFNRGSLNAQIEKIIFDQERGFVSDPIRVEAGFLILKVEDRHKEGQAPLEQVENEIMEKLYMPKFQPQIREYLTRLRQESFLEIKPGYVDSAAAPGKNTAWTDPAQLKPETVSKAEVANQTRRKKLLWMVPIPGTETSAAPKAGISSSK